MGYEGGDLDLY